MLQYIIEHPWIVLFVVATIVTIWVDEIREKLFIWTLTNDNPNINRLGLALTNKPFNCSNCLMFWSTLVLFFVSLEPTYLLGYLLIRIINKQL